MNPSITPPGPAVAPAFSQPPAQPQQLQQPAAPEIQDPRALFFGRQESPPPAAPSEPAAGGEFDVAGFVAKQISELLPDSLFKTDPDAKNIGGVREALAKSLERVTHAEMKLARAHKSGSGTADQLLRDKLSAAEMKLAETKEAEAELATLRARAELADNDSFQAAYTDKIAGAKKEALEIANEGGIDPAIVERAFAAESKLGISKVLAEVEDPEAKSLLADLVRGSFEAASKLKSEWKDPVKALQQWRAKQAESGFAKSTQNSTQAVALHRQAIQSAIAGDEAKGVIGNFALRALVDAPEGEAILGALERSYSSNGQLDHNEVIMSRVQAASVPSLLKYVVNLEGVIKTMQQQLLKYGGLQPSYSPGQQPGGDQRQGIWGSGGGVSQIGPAVPGAHLGPAIPGAQRG